MDVAAVGWTDAARGIAAIAQIVAIAIGGAWAYYKFVRGRTFKPRGEISLGVVLAEAQGQTGLSLTVTFRNVGLVYIDLPKPDAIRIVRVWGALAPQAGANPDWGSPLVLAELFASHGGCEVGETLADHVLLAVPHGPGAGADPWFAYRVEVTITSPTRVGRNRRSRPWTATRVVTGAAEDIPA